MRRLLYALVLVLGCLGAGFAQVTNRYEVLVQSGKARLQEAKLDQALASGEEAIKLNAGRWEAYALAGGALMNLKRYEEAADDFSKAIERAPASKQGGLRDLRKQCVLAETGITTSAPTSSQSSAAPPASTATQAEVVLWKSIENSQSKSDFEGYVRQYPYGTFITLAKQHIDELNEQADSAEKQRIQQQQAAATAAAAQWQAGEIFKVSGMGPIGSSDGMLVLTVNPNGVNISGPLGKKLHNAFSAPCSDLMWSPGMANAVYFVVKSTRKKYRVAPSVSNDYLISVLQRYCGNSN